MSDPSQAYRLDALSSGQPIQFAFGDRAFNELLLDLHVRRFTGLLRLGIKEAMDHVFFHGGMVVGMRVTPSQDFPLLRAATLKLRQLNAQDFDTLRQGLSDGVAFSRELIAQGWLSEEEVGQAMEGQARRRMFQLYDLDPSVPMRLQEGLEALSYFHPIHLDIRPIISFGFVMRSDAAREREIAGRVAGKRVRMIVPYDERRNSYGLPPPVMQAIRPLVQGVVLGSQPKLPALGSREVLGVLRLLEQMRLLKIEEIDAA